MQLQIADELARDPAARLKRDDGDAPDHAPGSPPESVQDSVLGPDHVPQNHGVRGGAPTVMVTGV